MNKSENVKFVVFVPLVNADAVREALAEAGAGKIGHYDSCSFSHIGEGRFRPLKGAKPTIGEIDKVEVVLEERIETIVPRSVIKEVIEKVRAVHPYEVMAYDVFALEDV